MNENQPTTKQLVVFTVTLSFVVSIIGTVLVLGVMGPLSNENGGSTFLFSRPKILDKLLSSSASSSEAPAQTQEDLVVKAVQAASPAVVSIVETKDVPVLEQYYINPFSQDPFFKNFFGDNAPDFGIPQYRQKGTQKQEVSSGTGFIVSSDGMIITNRHVVADTEGEYTVFTNDGKKYAAKVLARDPYQDIAILKIPASGLATLPLGDSSQLKIGQTVIAIGNALGEFRNTVSVGVVSGLERSVTASGGTVEPETLQELIQTDAAINPGNSGGPLLNLRGEVIGINVAMASGAQNIGFSLPINKAKNDIDNVQKSGRIIYPFLGVRYAPITQDLVDKQKLGRDYGVWLTEGENGEPAVADGSPAQAAGLKSGDIILKINGQRIDADHSLASLIQNYKVGDEITLRVFRDGNEFEVKVKLTERK